MAHASPLAAIAPLGFERILLDNQEIDVSDAIVAALGARPRQAQIAVAESINCVPPVGYPKSTVQDFGDYANVDSRLPEN
jgi:hypothetical protein